MPARSITNTVTDKTSTRLRAHIDGKDRRVIEYSDGTEIHTERTGEAAYHKGRKVMEKVQTITKTKTPVTTSRVNWKPGQYERIFGHD
jgi:hypothetical protein